MKFSDYLEYFNEEASNPNFVASDDWINNATREDLEKYLRTHEVGVQTREKIYYQLARMEKQAAKAEKINNKEGNPEIKDAKGKNPRHFLHLKNK